MNDLIEKTITQVKAILGEDTTGHDWFHIERVWNLAKHIGKEENVDMQVVELAALLHDIDDHKLVDYKEPRKAKAWLEEQQVNQEVLDHVLEIINTMSFKGKHESMKTREGEVVQDADRLDAIGAIGIARAFAYGGHVGNPLHDPEEKPRGEMTEEEYEKRRGSTINHFYEKLLKLKEHMNTSTGKRLAEERHAYMEAYLQQFYDEWKGLK